jgi:hypothetical protein
LTHTVSKALATSRKTAPVSLLSSVSVETFEKAGQLLRWWKAQLLVPQQSALFYFPEDPSENDFLIEFANIAN